MKSSYLTGAISRYWVLEKNWIGPTDIEIKRFYQKLRLLILGWKNSRAWEDECDPDIFYSCCHVVEKILNIAYRHSDQRGFHDQGRVCRPDAGRGIVVSLCFAALLAGQHLEHRKKNSLLGLKKWNFRHMKVYSIRPVLGSLEFVQRYWTGPVQDWTLRKILGKYFNFITLFSTSWVE